MTDSRSGKLDDEVTKLDLRGSRHLLEAATRHRSILHSTSDVLPLEDKKDAIVRAGTSIGISMKLAQSDRRRMPPSPLLWPEVDGDQEPVHLVALRAFQ
jgi:hypothetical protein